MFPYKYIPDRLPARLLHTVNYFFKDCCILCIGISPASQRGVPTTQYAQVAGKQLKLSFVSVIFSKELKCRCCCDDLLRRGRRQSNL